MKVLLLLFTFSLISGPVSCSEVIGYSGGTVIINCKHDRQLRRDHKYFCEISTNQCLYLEQTENTWSHKGRVDLYDNPGVLTVIYRNLRLQDAGSYQCGETGVWNQDVNLKVNEDPCCSGSKTVTGYLGETVTISCSYPEQEKENYKLLYKQDDQDFKEVIHSAENQKGRFSISEDRRSRVLSVRIRDVREDDGGVYYCGVWKEGEPVRYASLYTEIQLQVTAPGSSIIIIIVCICVVLLLIGGSALIFYRLRCRRTQDSASTSTRPGANETVNTDYENDPPGKRNNINITPVYQNLKPNTNQSDLVYQSLDPGSREPNSVYYSLRTNNTRV